MKILVIQASGVGCMIMATPALRYIRRQCPQAEIDLLVTQPSFALPVRDGDLVKRVFLLPVAKEHPWRSIVGSLWRVWRLRRQRYDLTITLFPSRKPHFALLSLAINAITRVGHEYAGISRLGQAIWRLAYTHRVMADLKRHDVEQNFALVQTVFPGGGPQPGELEFSVPTTARATALAFVHHHRLDRHRPIGMHPGSSKEFGFAEKRWPIHSFAALAQKVIDDLQRPVLIFFGPDERDLRERLEAIFSHEWLITVQEDLGVTAELIRGCEAFVSNDSGLMHLAAAMGIPMTIGLFGPTNASRTHPWGCRHVVIQRAAPEEIFTYPFTEAKTDLGGQAQELMTRIGVDEVYQALVHAIGHAAATLPCQPSEDSRPCPAG